MLFVSVNFIISAEFLINGDEFYNYNLGSRTITGLLTARSRADTRGFWLCFLTPAAEYDAC
jgi:hypothetical protein